MLDPEDNSTILPLQSGWGGVGVGDCGGGEGDGGGEGGVGDGGGVGGANLLNLTSCLASWLVGWETLGGANWSDRCLCVCLSVCSCVCVKQVLCKMSHIVSDGRLADNSATNTFI